MNASKANIADLCAFASWPFAFHFFMALASVGIGWGKEKRKGQRREDARDLATYRYARPRCGRSALRGRRGGCRVGLCRRN